jgi:tetratricopeptide (TPR) repeat protein
MLDKKRSSVPKIAEKRTPGPHADGSDTAPETVRAIASPAVGAIGPSPLDSQRQLAAFEGAMRLFHARKLREARDLFTQASAGPERDVAQRAGLHIVMCNRRLEQAPVALGGAEDYYNYGIALLNSRNVTAAVEHLDMALRLAPGSDHIYYALGLARALAGDLGGAYESLKRAIELDPRNRIVARQDADIAHLAGQPPFEGLLYPEKKGW